MAQLLHLSTSRCALYRLGLGLQVSLNRVASNCRYSSLPSSSANRVGTVFPYEQLPSAYGVIFRKMNSGATKKGLLERLAAGVVVGDGGMIWQLEQRGYAKAGPYTPEACIEHPEAVLQLHREFIRNGSEVVQCATFWASEERLQSQSGAVNDAACSLALKAASEGEDILVAGGVSRTDFYREGRGKAVVQAEFKKQLDYYVQHNLDFVVAEYLDHVEEAEWAVEVLRTAGKPVMATLCIGPKGDIDGVSAGECAVRLVNAGAHVVGINCRFGPNDALETIKLMKAGLQEAGVHAYLAVQPYGYHTPDSSLAGYTAMAEFPFAVEPRLITRPDAHKYALAAYEIGVHYIGGCCGFVPMHIRAVAEALQEKRGGRVAPITKRYGKWLDSLEDAKMGERSKRDYWLNIEPATGRPYSSSKSEPVLSEKQQVEKSADF